MTRIDQVLNYKSEYIEDGVLKNKLNITNIEELEKMERMMTSYKLANLYLNPGNQTFDVNHYLNIHKYLFEDIYDFAGQIRSENINKVVPFCVPELIYENLKATLDKARRQVKSITNEEQLIDFITYYYSELDIIHPFREGNGRCEREFLRQYVEKINEMIDFGPYKLDYSLIENKDEFIKAVIIADAYCELNPLKEFIKKIVVKEKEKSK